MAVPRAATQEDDMRRTDNAMSSTLKSLGRLLQGGDGAPMCYLISFVVFVFLLVYYLLRAPAS